MNRVAGGSRFFTCGHHSSAGFLSSPRTDVIHTLPSPRMWLPGHLTAEQCAPGRPRHGDKNKSCSCLRKRGIQKKSLSLRKNAAGNDLHSSSSHSARRTHKIPCSHLTYYKTMWLVRSRRQGWGLSPGGWDPLLWRPSTVRALKVWEGKPSGAQVSEKGS